MTGDRSNYVEMLEAEVRRLQAEVTRLTRREDTGDSAIIGELVAASRSVLSGWDSECASGSYGSLELSDAIKSLRSALTKVGGS